MDSLSYTYGAADGNLSKKHAKIDDFASKFSHEKINTPKVFASKNMSKSMIWLFDFVLLARADEPGVRDHVLEVRVVEVRFPPDGSDGQMAHKYSYTC